MPYKKNDKNNIQSPKGMRDILAEEYVFYRNIFDKAEEIASYYGFKPIQTPHLEKTELFTVAIGQSTDIVEKEMYTLKTRGGDNLALRPEGTAPVIRAYIEHGMHTLPQPVMLWYEGSFFRHESPQRGRFREFQQFGLEIIGEAMPIGEAIVIQVIFTTLKELGLGPLTVGINSIGDKECRGEYRKKLLGYYRKNKDNLCKDCKKRIKTNPLRLLDCKESCCLEIKKNAPQTVGSLCASCKQHFKEVLEFLGSSEIPYFLDTHLVRGLDYYSRTVFEIFADDKSGPEDSTPLSLAGGGRFDYLAKILGKRNAPGIGGGIGADRVATAMRQKNIIPKQKGPPEAFFIQLSQTAKQKSLNIIEKFRTADISIAQSISKDNLNSQLGLASKLKVPYVLIMGQKETLENSIIIRDMDSGTQESAPIEKVVEIFKKKIKKEKEKENKL